ncbi:hypothetical protein [Caldisphaera sp.]|uniref:hypothetical protein n=1 Tax=Caldisphaera sp. TaxID=2060322 RepID=UPI0025C6DC6C|nr:hypothetical protein [Caldisphaera sp.]
MIDTKLNRYSKTISAVIIISIIIAIVFSPLFNLYLFGIRPKKDTLTIYSIYEKGDDSQIIKNASYSVWVFYPTKNGTVFQSIYNGTGGIININMSSLINWAKSWIKYYGYDSIFSFMPSLIIFSSYEINPNNTVEIITQQEMVPLNLSYPLNGKGYVVSIEFSHPLISKINENSEKKISNNNTVSLEAIPMQTTSTTTITLPPTSYIEPHVTTTISGLLYVGALYFSPKVISWYPNNTGIAPISLAIALAEPNYEYNTTFSELEINTIFADAYINEESFNAVSIASNAFLSSVDYAELNEISKAMNSLFPIIPGATLTFTQVSQVYSANNIFTYTLIGSKEDIGQLYVLGQTALINWTVYDAMNEPVSWLLGMQLTALQVLKSYSSIAPALYSWEAYDPCINISQWAKEYNGIIWDNQAGQPIPISVINSTCPIPNTPAPVDWQDYEYNTTLNTTVGPSTKILYSYVNLEKSDVPSTIGSVLDVGSALASTAGIVSLASGIGAPVSSVAFTISGILNSIQFSSNSIALQIVQITVNNRLPIATSVYYSNMTPLYIMNGVNNYTLPRELILINAS